MVSAVFFFSSLSFCWYKCMISIARENQVSGFISCSDPIRNKCWILSRASIKWVKRGFEGFHSISLHLLSIISGASAAPLAGPAICIILGVVITGVLKSCNKSKEKGSWGCDTSTGGKSSHWRTLHSYQALL